MRGRLVPLVIAGLISLGPWFTNAFNSGGEVLKRLQLTIWAERGAGGSCTVPSHNTEGPDTFDQDHQWFVKQDPPRLNGVRKDHDRGRGSQRVGAGGQPRSKFKNLYEPRRGMVQGCPLHRNRS